MSNPIDRQAVGDAFGLDAGHRTADVFKRLVSAGMIPAPLDASYDQFDLTAVQAKLSGSAAAVSFARKVVAEHRGGPKAVV